MPTTVVPTIHVACEPVFFIYICVISPGNVQLPINVVVGIILALASLMSNIFLILTPITIFDRYLA